MSRSPIDEIYPIGIDLCQSDGFAISDNEIISLFVLYTYDDIVIIDFESRFEKTSKLAKTCWKFINHLAI